MSSSITSPVFRNSRRKLARSVRSSDGSATLKAHRGTRKLAKALFVFAAAKAAVNGLRPAIGVSLRTYGKETV